MTFEAPGADEPRAHWQFLATGAGRLLDGRGEHDLEPERPTLFTPPEGSVAWQVPRQRHLHLISVDVTASALAHWCDSREAHALMFDTRRAPLALGTRAQHSLYGRLRRLASAEGGRGAAWRLRCESLALEALATGLDHLGLAPVRGEIGAGDAARLKRVRECLEDDPVPPVTLLALAGTVGMPVRRLQRLYERRHGEPLREALYRARLEAARRTLLGGQLSIKQVARHAGFVHPTSFTHAFKAWFGHPPSELTSRRPARRTP